MRRPSWALLIASGAAAVLGGAAYASIPNQEQQVFACYALSGNKAGLVRFVDTFSQCKANEGAVALNAGRPSRVDEGSLPAPGPCHSGSQSRLARASGCRRIASTRSPP